jgi:hypothetical protein
MTLGARNRNRSDPWVASGVAVACSILCGVLAPHYAVWYGDSIPQFTRVFLSWYQLWIAITVVSLIVQLLAKLSGPRGYRQTRLETLDSALGLVSVLIVVLEIVALLLPEMHPSKVHIF